MQECKEDLILLTVSIPLNRVGFVMLKYLVRDDVTQVSIPLNRVGFVIK